MSKITPENLDFNLLFANSVNREDMEEDTYLQGWYKIVGGLNGIPTTKQFNALQHISDLKSKYLYYNKLDKQGGVADDLVIAFTKAAQRENIESGESIKTVMGKINKYFSDLQNIAFSGKYSDISGAPASLKNPNSLFVKLNGTTAYSYDGSVSKSIDFKAGSNISLGLDTDGKLTIDTDFSNLADVAFSGKYSDIINAPTSLKNPTFLSVKLEGAEKYSYDGSVSKSINFKAGTNISLDLDVNGNMVINGNYTYTHPTGAGYNHIPPGGSNGQWLKWSSAGMAAWGTLLANNLTQSSAGQYALDSYQGKILKGLIDGHTADIGQLNTNLANKAEKSDVGNIGDISIPGMISLVQAINHTANLTNYTLPLASTSGTIADALRIDTASAFGINNKPYVVAYGTTTVNMPTDLAWGIREVLWITIDKVLVRITGINLSGTTSVIYTNCYNAGIWTGWIKH